MENVVTASELKERNSINHIGDLLKLLFFRLFRDAAFYVMLGISVAVSILLGIILSSVAKGLDGGITMLEMWCAVMGNASASLAIMLMFGLMVCTTLVGREFNYGTIRNVLLAGKKRSEFFLAVMIFAITLELFFYLIPILLLVLSSAFAGIAIFPDGINVSWFIGGFIMLLLYGLSSCCFVVSLMFVMGKGSPSYWIFYGLTIGVYALFMILSLVISINGPRGEQATAESVNNYLNNWKIFVEFIPVYQANYFRSMGDLTTLTVSTSMISGIQMEEADMASVITKATIEYVAWAGLWIFLGLRTFQHKDLK